MKLIAFVVSLMLTIALIVLLNVQLPVGGNKTPELGAFLSPQHGCWQNAEPLEANFDGDVKLPSLAGKTVVYFDERLVPHINADNEHDAYFVQGFLHAKFRLWQMEFQTHAAAGRLTEILGPKSGSTDLLTVADRYFRRLGMTYAAEKSLALSQADPMTRLATDAYTSGVNAYISSLTESSMPLEYKLLGYKPEPWSNLKTALLQL